MAYIINKNNIFLHIPKTGGSWVNYIIENSNLDIKKIGFNKHVTYDYISSTLNESFDKSHIYRRLLPRFFIKDYNYFAVIRNPLTWYESFYKHLKRNNYKNYGSVANSYKWHVWACFNDIEHDDFNSFIAEILKNYPGYLTYLYNSYLLNSGAFYLKKESLRDDLYKLGKVLNINFSEELIFSSEKRNTSDQEKILWNEENFKKVILQESTLFDKYNYQTQGVVELI